MKRTIITFVVLVTTLVSFNSLNSNIKLNDCFDANVEALARSEHNYDDDIWYVFYREDGGINCTPSGKEPCRRPGEVSTNA